jgi:CPA2 family monovalent cation:H+ antiporter-2
VLNELGQLVVLFGSGLLAAWLMRLLRAPAIIGYLLAGMLIGESGLALVRADDLHFVAELGLALLLFTVGLELSPEPLLANVRALLVASGLQIGVTALIAAGVAVLLAGVVPAGAVLIGLVAAMSSTAIVLKQLSDRSATDSIIGRLVTGVLLVQDVCVIVVLVGLPLLAPSAAANWSETALRIGLSLGGLLVATVLAWYVLPGFVNVLFRAGGTELMTLFAIVAACTGAWLAGLANWSWALGACIAGLLLAGTDLRHQLWAEISPLRDACSAVFFLSIGMLFDIGTLAAQPLLIVGLIGATVAVKFGIAALAVLAGRWGLRVALTAGLGLATVSEFGYVLIKDGQRHGLVAPDALPLLMTWITGTMLLGTMLLPAGTPIATFVCDRLALGRRRPAVAAAPAPAAAEQAGLKDHVIIVGYGLNGRNLANVLRATGIGYVVIELNRAGAAGGAAAGHAMIVGDATRRAILEAAGIARARALVVAISDAYATRRVVAQARALRPDLYILARTRYISELDKLYQLGAREVVPEEFETSIEIFAHVLREFAVPDNVIEQQVSLIRAGRYQMLRGRVSDRAHHAEWLRLIETAVTRTFMLLEGSPAVGKTIGELALRSRMGVTVVAVTRKGRPLPAPGADFRFELGDVVVIVGGHANLDRARKLLSPPPAEVTPEP